MFTRHLITSAIAFALWMIFGYAALFLYRSDIAGQAALFLWHWEALLIGIFSFLLFPLLPPAFRKWPYVFTYIFTMPVLITTYWLCGGLLHTDIVQKEAALVFSSIGGYLFIQSKPYVYRYIYPASLILVCIFCYAVVLPMWDHYSIYGAFKPAVSQDIPDGWYVYNERKEIFDKNDWKNKTVVMELWSKDCGPCKHSLPELQKFYNQHKDEDMLIEAVHVPFFNREVSADSGFYYAREKGYSFPVVIGSSSMLDLFKVHAIPTIIVLRNNKIVFRGGLEQLSEFFSNK